MNTAVQELGFRCPDKPLETSPKVVAGLSPVVWLGQAKYDGWRMQIYYREDGQIDCLTRVGTPIEQTSAKFDPNFKKLLAKIKVFPGTVLDAEFVGPRGHLKPSIYIFDMLAWKNQWLVNEPYQNRWGRCKRLHLPGDPIFLAETVENNFIEFFEKLKNQWDGSSICLHEGIVLKSRGGKMKLDRNKSVKSATQLKLKFREIRGKKY